jgi:ubiquinone/menaquinone biosynthesis C-methylase UbiE
MNEETLKAIAAQLRRPEGEPGVQVGMKMNEGNSHINLYTIAALNPQPQEHILEIGMGNGFFVKDILSIHESIRYTGCDFSEAMAEEAKRINKSFVVGGRAEFHFGAADNMPFDGGVFDAVLTVNTIYFWDDNAKVLTEIRRVLKPSGRLVVSVRPRSVMELYPFTKYGFNMFSKDELADVISGNGFRIKEILEKKEPDQEINGKKVVVESLIVVAEKISAS